MSKTISRNTIDDLYSILKNCQLCPHNCEVDRFSGELGICRVDANLLVSSVQQHFGEERPLVGRGGSGTIFLAGCNLECVYCQNYDISQHNMGRVMSAERIADNMLYLQNSGAHNINFVTPTHQIPMIVDGISIALERGLTVPIVYNCGGYENVEVIRKLEGIVDIYMPDIKYYDNSIALKYSGTPDYVERMQESVIEMQRQVGDLSIDSVGIAQKGLLIRHLVLPNNLSSSEQVLDFVKNLVSENAYVNVMAQYHPCYKAYDFPLLKHRLYMDSYRMAKDYAAKIGLTRGLE